MTRVHQATGETLLVPLQKWAEAGSRITGNTGKAVEDERESEGSIVAVKRSNEQREPAVCKVRTIREARVNDKSTH
jgi:hypothetical protein